MNVSANLLEYLKKNDRAELTGIGTFRVEYTPASISPITNTLTPPSRIITFSNEINNDLGFVQELSKKEFISLETSLKWIKQYSDSVKEKVEKSNSCKLGEIGVLTKGLSSGYIFTPTSGLNLLDSAFAFSTIKSVKTFDQGDYIKPIVTKEPLDELPKEGKVDFEDKPIQSIVVGTSFSDQDQSPLNAIKEKYEQTPQTETQEKIDYSIDLEQEKTKEIVFEEREDFQRDIEIMEEARKEVQERLDKIKEDKEEELGENEGMDANDSDAFNYRNSKKFRKNVKKRRKSDKKERKERRKRNKKTWLILSLIVLLALLASGFLVLAHYMCWTKNIEALKPITEKLNNYITPKCESEKKTILIPVQTKTTQIEETPIEETIASEIAPIKEITIKEIKTEVQTPTKPIQPKKEIVVKEKPLKPTGEKDNPPVPTPEIDYSKPVLMQPVSRLGFDVVGGTYDNLANAQQSARKARSLGYDSYIVSKSQDDKTKYYVSYGSRRTMGEANAFMSSIIKKHGDSGYYIISR